MRCPADDPVPDRPRYCDLLIEDRLIALPDGTAIGARIWRPDPSRYDLPPLPAVLEFLPYRKRGGGIEARDELTLGAYARAGIVALRADLRGSGESDGISTGEYTPQELQDACALIAWIAAQPWCSGAVGMQGISWGGFNALQTAALAPPALKAVIALAATVDRFADDIHSKGGAQLGANFGWSVTMLAYQSRPPDPALRPDDWRALWLQRLAEAPWFLADWLAHQRRDSFWQQGSLCADFAALRIPALVVAGWADGYRNTPLKALEGAPGQVRALIGPWVHRYPHIATPGPRMDFLAEAIAWWRRWLCGDAGAQGGEAAADIGAIPALRAYLTEAVRPGPDRQEDPGRWVALDHWAEGPAQRWQVQAGLLVPVPAEAQPQANAAADWQAWPGTLATGLAAGEYFATAARDEGGAAGDQAGDDAHCLVLDSAALQAPLDVLGWPRLRLVLRWPDSARAPAPQLVVRLCDLHPDGLSHRVSWGVLNLAHRDGSAMPQPLPDGALDPELGPELGLELRLDACGHRFRPGHRLRLAFSGAAFPLVLPAPGAAAGAVDLARLALDLPGLGAHRPIVMAPPPDTGADAALLADYPCDPPARAWQRIWRSPDAEGRLGLEICADSGGETPPQHGLTSRECREERWTIRPDDPLSLTGDSTWRCDMARAATGWAISTVTRAQLRASASHWQARAQLSAYEAGKLIFTRDWDLNWPRDLT